MKLAPQRELLLIGGGHAHVQLLRRHAMAPIPGTRVTVVVDNPVAVYSGMVPGVVARQYRADEVEIDVWTLARRCGASIVAARALRMDAQRCLVEVEGRPPLPYDFASIDIGSTVGGLDLPGVAEHAIATRPIAAFVARVDRLDQGSHAQVVVVGGGAAGIEIAFTLQARLRAPVTLVDAHDQPLGGMQAAVRRRVLAAAARRGVSIVAGARVSVVEPRVTQLTDGRVVPYDLLVWATGAAAHRFGVDSGLPVDERGFIRVGPTLQVEGLGNVFGGGDCVHLSHAPVPKAGVYAVREGPVLDANLRACITGSSLQRYEPQRDFLALLNLGDGSAIGARAGFTAEGAWVWRLKDRIDRAFMAKFQLLAADDTATDALPVMDMDRPCGGCAAKLGQAELNLALTSFATTHDPSVELGLSPPDDAAIVRLTGGARVGLTVDALTAFCDDPWWVGKIAAVNAVNDLFAKGIRPRWALATIALPHGANAARLAAVMGGVRAALDPLGVTVVGGHTIFAAELQVGLSVMGEPERAPIRQDAVRAGDVLLLTRPLGSGVLLRADMLGLARAAWVRPVLDTMGRSHADAAAALAGLDVHGATDVTGFGLAGHLVGMLTASGARARISLGALPRWPGVDGLFARGLRSTFHAQNRRAASAIEGAVDDLRAEILFDPQTAGPLLLAVPPEALAAVTAALRAVGEGAEVFGEVLPDGAGKALIFVD